MTTIYINEQGQERATLPTSAIIGGKLVTGPKAAEGWTPKRVVEGTEQKQEPRAAYPAELAIRQLALKYVPAEKLDRNPATVIAAIDAASTKGTQDEQVAVLRDALRLIQLFLAVKELGGGPESPDYLQEFVTVTTPTRSLEDL